MPTSFSEIIVEYAMLEIDDIRLQENLQENPALFFRRMTAYLKNAIPYFSSPPQMHERLEYVSPVWDDYVWEGVASATKTVVATEKTGYELMSVQIMKHGPDDVVFAIPYSEATYDPDTGNVTFPPGVGDGEVFEMDFYTDGYFNVDLNNEEKRILGLCVSLVWYERFSTNWLNMQPKLQDQNFSLTNEGTHIRAVTERIKEVRSSLNGEIRKYEQNLAYARTVLNKGEFPPFF